jgi:hypothetical protein
VLIPLAITIWLRREELWPLFYWISFALVAYIEASLASEHDSTVEGIYLGTIIFLLGFLPLRVEKYIREKRKQQKKSPKKKR